MSTTFFLRANSEVALGAYFKTSGKEYDEDSSRRLSFEALCIGEERR